MLRIVILIIVFALVTWFLYRKVYKFLVILDKEMLSGEPSFEDRKINIELEGEKFDADLKQRESELNKESKKLKKFKAERNKR